MSGGRHEKLSITHHSVAVLVVSTYVGVVITLPQTSLVAIGAHLTGAALSRAILLAQALPHGIVALGVASEAGVVNLPFAPITVALGRAVWVLAASNGTNWNPATLLLGKV